MQVAVWSGVNAEERRVRQQTSPAQPQFGEVDEAPEPCGAIAEGEEPPDFVGNVFHHFQMELNILVLIMRKNRLQEAVGCQSGDWRSCLAFLAVLGYS